MLFSILKWTVIGVGVLAALLALGAIMYRDIPAAELEARWAKPPSKFIELDGVRFHYRDSGNGPAVVLIHANYANAFMWEPWAKALEDRYRVIRLDMTGHGLTGPDASGDYSLARTVRHFELFVDALELDRFTAGGGSLGGTVAMHYTVEHPERVRELILVNPGSLEKDVRGRDKPVDVPRAVNVLAYVTPRFFVSGLLNAGYGDKEKLTDAVIDEWYDMWLRDGNRMAMLGRLRQYISGDVEGKIRALQVPVLLVWGEKNTRVPLPLAYEFQKLLVSSPDVRLEVLEGVGHMAVQEAPEESARIVRAYLDAARARDQPAPAVARAEVASAAAEAASAR